MKKKDFDPRYTDAYIAICLRMINELTNSDLTCLSSRHPCNTQKCPFYDTTYCYNGRILPAAKEFIALFTKERFIVINKEKFYESKFKEK